MFLSRRSEECASSFVVANSFILRKRTSGNDTQLQCLTVHCFIRMVFLNNFEDIFLTKNVLFVS